ncbi:MAG: class I SAM-dependent methyltransferase [Ruminococcaceae bacterium]|nr:class I SAM-dependent methyltransferase [Oscillospiraceae bacterium]
MDRFTTLNEFYTKNDEDMRFESKHGQVEYLTTLKYIEKYLEKGMKIIEIGAGTGRYSHYFARKGYEVDAIELMECNVEAFKKNTHPNEKVTISQGDAIELDGIPSEVYDVTLLLGPMYHLYTVEDQLSALSEAIRVTKKNGVVFVAYCMSDMTMYQYCFGRNMILDANKSNKIDENFKLYSLPEDIFQLYRKEDIDALMADFCVNRLHYVGTDMLTHMMRECVDSMTDEVFDIYMRYHFNVCERPDMIGATNHVLDVFRKV